MDLKSAKAPFVPVAVLVVDFAMGSMAVSWQLIPVSEFAIETGKRLESLQMLSKAGNLTPYSSLEELLTPGRHLLVSHRVVQIFSRVRTTSGMEVEWPPDLPKVSKEHQERVHALDAQMDRPGAVFETAVMDLLGAVWSQRYSCSKEGYRLPPLLHPQIDDSGIHFVKEAYAQSNLIEAQQLARQDQQLARGKRSLCFELLLSEKNAKASLLVVPLPSYYFHSFAVWSRWRSF